MTESVFGCGLPDQVDEFVNMIDVRFTNLRQELYEMSLPTPWQRRFRKLAVFAGTISSLYLLANYTFDRLRESRVRSVKDRHVKDR